jgi:nucleoside-diphosphate-sugar epimerase
MDNQNYLITGGAGFIGSHLVDRLLSSPDNNVVVFDNLRRGRMENISRHLDDPRFKFISGDLRKYSDVNEAVQGMDFIFHLGAQSNVMGAVTDPDYSFETNVIGTYNVLKAASTAKSPKVIFSSSREVYGEPKEIPVKEDCPRVSKNPYGASKIAGELYFSVFQSLFNLNISILRFSNVYGSRDFDRVIPLWMERARKNENLTVFGGNKTIDFISVEIVVEALIQAAHRDTGPSPINVGSGKGTNILDLAHKILVLTKSRSEIELLSPREAEVNNYVADVTLMSSVLGILPPGDPLDKLINLSSG